MRKDKLIITITTFIACLVLVMTMFMQFKVVNQTDITSIETMTESELRAEKLDINEKYDKLTLQYSETLIKLQEYKEEYKTDGETRKLLEKELYQLKTLLGITSIQGQGVIIEISEDGLKDDRINYEDLLLIINSLKVAGADAISINGERIIATTDIRNITPTYIKVNDGRVVSPYTIKAIGNQAYLESALLMSGGYIDILQDAGFTINIQRDNNIEIGAYAESINTKYIK